MPILTTRVGFARPLTRNNRATFHAEVFNQGHSRGDGGLGGRRDGCISPAECGGGDTMLAGRPSVSRVAAGRMPRHDSAKAPAKAAGGRDAARRVGGGSREHQTARRRRDRRAGSEAIPTKDAPSVDLVRDHAARPAPSRTALARSLTAASTIPRRPSAISILVAASTVSFCLPFSQSWS